MPKKEKKNKETEIVVSEEPEINKLEVISKIEELRGLAKSCFQNKEFEKAIVYAEFIIRFAIMVDSTTEIKEQEAFIKSIADKVQEDYLLDHLKEITGAMKEIFEALLDFNRVEDAHEVIDRFKEKYQESDFLR